MFRFTTATTPLLSTDFSIAYLVNFTSQCDGAHGWTGVKGRNVYSGWHSGLIHHGRAGMAAGAEDGWSHYIYSQEATGVDPGALLAWFL